MSIDSDRLKVTVSQNIFLGGGEMGARMQAYNWEAHPLGNPDHWPQSLKSNIRLILNSAFPMFIWWSKDLYSFHNDAYLPALGKKHPEALGKSATEVWAEIWDQLQGIVENILKTGEAFYTEDLRLILERKGFAEETYWTFSYSAVYNDSGEVDGIFCACHEVTATVLGQRRLKVLKDISEAFNDVLTLEQACQSTCDILYRNNSADLPFCIIYLLEGASREARRCGEAGGIPDAGAPAIIALDAQEMSWPLAQAQQSRQLVLVDLEQAGLGVADTSSTNRRPRQAVVFPVFKPGQNKLLGYFISGVSPSLVYDADYENFHGLLTIQLANAIVGVQAREENLRQQKFLNDVFQQAPVGITIVRGPKYIIELANPGVCEIWRKKPEEVLGKPVLEALPEMQDQGIQQLLDDVYYTGKPYVNRELPLIFERNGKPEQVYVSFVYHPVRDIQGTVTGIIAVAIDINEQVNARHEIEAINRQLLATNADLDNFVYSASHDLKAPISNIEGLMVALVDQLSAETLKSETVKRLIDYIQSSVERFKKAVTDLSQVAKIQREAGEDIAHINISETIDEVRLDFENSIAESRARLDVHIDPEAASLRLSNKNLRSIIYNLLSNALKYRAPDRHPYITISTKAEQDYIILSVADNGLGVDLTKEAKMFSMFKRLHDHVEGSGVGLYIVKRIVESAGGKIIVESKLGEGSVFNIYFKK